MARSVRAGIPFCLKKWFDIARRSELPAFFREKDGDREDRFERWLTTPLEDRILFGSSKESLQSSRMMPMAKKNSITASQEDYLETIYHIAAEKHAARAKDIATAMKVKASSVTGALRLLAEKGLINYAPYDVITLTPEGTKVAEEVVRRHEVLNDFFSRILGVESRDAENAACEMEHALPQSVLDRLIQFIQFLDVCPRAGVDWIEAFRAFCREGVSGEKCVSCAFQSLEALKAKRSDKLRQGDRTVPLSGMEPGQRGRVVKIKGKGTIRERFMKLDLAPGAIIEVEKSQGDGSEVRVKGYHRSLRSDDADRVIVETL